MSSGPYRARGTGISWYRAAPMKKILLIIAAVIVCGLLLIFVILPLIINANSFKPRVQDELSKALGRQVTIGDLSTSIWSGGIKAKTITIADDPAFEPQPFITASSLRIGVDLPALIFSRNVKIRSLDLLDPTVRLLQNEAGQWNFASIAAKNANTTATSTQGRSSDQVSIDRVKIEGGQITVGRIGQTLHTYRDVLFTAKGISYNKSFPFELTGKTPGDGWMQVSGTEGPINAQNAAATPFQAKITIRKLELAMAGFGGSASTMGGTLDFDADAQSNGTQMQSHGDITVTKAQFAGGSQPSTVPITVHYAATYNIPSETADITTGTINIGKAAAQVTGTIDEHPNSPGLNLHVTGDAMPIEALQAALPAFGVAPPPAVKVHSGTASADFQITGPLSDPVTTGTATAKDVLLEDFDLGSHLKVISTLAGISTSKDTQITQLSAKIRNSKQGTAISELNIVVPTIGTLTGQGTVGPNNALDLHLVVHLTKTYSPLDVLVKSASPKGGAGIPVTVKGTTQNPQFLPEVVALVKKSLGTGAISSAVQGLLGTKKKP